MAKESKRAPDKQKSPFSVVLRTLMSRKPATTQEKIAEITGKTRQTVSQYVNGISEPGYDTLIKIADYFNVSIDYLLGRTQDPAPICSSADELGLSPDTIKWLMEVKQNGLSGELSRIVENVHFQKLVYNILDYALLEDAEIIYGHVIDKKVRSMIEATKTKKNFIDLFDKEYIRYMNQSTGRIKEALRAIWDYENALANTDSQISFGVLYNSESKSYVALSDMAKLRVNNHLGLLFLTIWEDNLKKHDVEYYESEYAGKSSSRDSENKRNIFRNLP